MYILTHVYYANRFEPGMLFPDTYRIDNAAKMELQVSAMLNAFAISSEPLVSADSGIKSYDAAQFDFDTTAFMSFKALYLATPSGDFNIDNVVTYADTQIVTYLSDSFAMGSVGRSVSNGTATQIGSYGMDMNITSVPTDDKFMSAPSIVPEQLIVDSTSEGTFVVSIIAPVDCTFIASV